MAKIATNSLSQWPTPQNAPANPRNSPHNCVSFILYNNIIDLLADQRGFELPIGLSKYPFEMSAEFPLMCRKMDGRLREIPQKVQKFALHPLGGARPCSILFGVQSKQQSVAASRRQSLANEGSEAPKKTARAAWYSSILSVLN